MTSAYRLMPLAYRTMFLGTVRGGRRPYPAEDANWFVNLKEVFDQDSWGSNPCTPEKLREYKAAEVFCLALLPQGHQSWRILKNRIALLNSTGARPLLHDILVALLEMARFAAAEEAYDNATPDDEGHSAA